jgi:hypothetical protein
MTKTKNDAESVHCEARGPLMEWTTTKPTEPGWYWWRGRPNIEPDIHKVSARDIEDQADGLYSFPPGEWSGPIDPPREARGEPCRCDPPGSGEEHCNQACYQAGQKGGE